MLAVALCIALAAAAGIWYPQEGCQAINLWFSGSNTKAQDITSTAAHKNELPALHLEIEPRDYRTLETQRDKALQEGVLQLEDENWVRAKVRTQDQAIPVDLRLKADWTDPFEDKKWPLQITVQDEAYEKQGTTILGMRSFSAQSPATSGYLNGWLYTEDLRRAGILAPRSHFANVLVNGDDWGVYALRESISQEFLSHRLPASQVYDPQQMGRYLAHVNLWGAGNGLEWHNEQLYHNPLTSRFEPIGHDAFSGAPGDAPLADLAQYDDLSIMAAYAQEVTRIAQPKYLRELRSTYAKTFERYYAALAQEFATMDLEAPWDRLAARQHLLLQSLHPVQTVHARQLGSEWDDIVTVEVCNLLRYPIALAKLTMGNREADVRADWIAEDDKALLHQEAMPTVVLRRARGNVPEYVTLRIPASVLDGLQPPEASPDVRTLQLVTHLVGVGEQVVVNVQRDEAFALPKSVLPIQPSVDQALAQHPFLELAERPGFLRLKPGSWHVEGDLVLPDRFGLQTAEPVTLTFGQRALLFANGPLLLQGTNPGGIHLLPEEDRWAGLLVLRANPDEPSLFYDVEIRGTSGIQRGGWRTRGGITFYESPMVFSHCRLWDPVAPAAIHIVRSDFELVRTAFQNTAADAFAGDSSQGRIEQCTFYNVRGNGIDLSGSHVAMADVELLHVYGQGISAGEGSAVTVKNVRAADVHIPLVSLDMSSADVRGMRIARAWTAGFAAYRERLGYGTTAIAASEVVFQDDSIQALVQQGSSATINGTLIAARELDVGELHHRQSTLAAMQALDYEFGSQIGLLGYNLATPELGPGDTMMVTLYWYALAEPSQDYTVFLHLLNDAGQTVVGWDNMPCQDACPMTQWKMGRLVDDVHLVPFPADMPAGDYRVALGLYTLQTGERLPAYGPAGEQIPNGAAILDQIVRVRA